MKADKWWNLEHQRFSYTAQYFHIPQYILGNPHKAKQLLHISTSSGNKKISVQDDESSSNVRTSEMLEEDSCSGRCSAHVTNEWLAQQCLDMAKYFSINLNTDMSCFMFVPILASWLRAEYDTRAADGNLTWLATAPFGSMVAAQQQEIMPIQLWVDAARTTPNMKNQRLNWMRRILSNKGIKGPDNPTCEVLCRPAWYAFGKRWVVWDEWCELVVWDEGCGIEWCEMSGVRWVVWDGLCVRWVVCEMSGVRWVVWDGWCEMSCVSCKWDEWYEMRGVRWVVWISGAGWVVWDELCEMSGVN